MRAPAPTINHRSVPQLGRFEEVTFHEVITLLRAAPNKQCFADHAATYEAGFTDGRRLLQI